MHFSANHMKTMLAKTLARVGFARRIHIAPGDPRSQSWAQLVSSYEEVPDIYRTFFDALPASESSPFPYTVLTPTFKGVYRKPEHERLVCIAGSHIHVLERIEDRFVSTSYRLDDVSCVETGVILLHSWITIHGFSDRGLASSTTLLFNSVTDHVMAPLLERMRYAQAGATHAGLGTERARLSELADVNFKFMSYGERSIPPRAKVDAILYQPEIRFALPRLARYYFSKLISPAHMVILTDRELILLRDDYSQKWLRGSPHGAIWTMCHGGESAQPPLVSKTTIRYYFPSISPTICTLSLSLNRPKSTSWSGFCSS